MEEEIEDEDLCFFCLDTGEYFNGSQMEICSCESGDILRNNKEKNVSDNETKGTSGKEDKA